MSKAATTMTEEMWLRELNRIAKPSKQRPFGATVEELAEKASLSTTAIRNRVRTLIRAGKWQKTGVVKIMRIDGKQQDVACYGPVRK